MGKGMREPSPKKTFLLDLTLGVEQLWKGFKSETRTSVRKAERQGVEIYEPKSLHGWLEDYYAMHEAVYLRQKAKPPAKSVFYQALWDHLYEKGQLKVILARHNGRTIAGGIFPIYKDTIYFLDGACFREHGATKSSTMKDVQMEETVLLTSKYWRISSGSWRIRLLRGGARLRRIAYYLWQGDAPWLFRVIWSRMGFS